MAGLWPARTGENLRVTQIPRADLAPLHRAARLEDAVHALIARRMRRRGWHLRIVAYTGYGAPGWVRVIARVLLIPGDPATPRRVEKVRGWRHFATLPAKGVQVVIQAGDHRHEARTDRSGFIDCVVDADLAPGWRSVTISCDGAENADEPVNIIHPEATFGIISDIDDTVMVTALPRPLLAAWNTFVLDEHARMAVPGMAVLFERLSTAHPGAPVFYLSTGAFNVAPALSRFLSRHLYPAGPLLLTDWGPTTEGWFRSGPEHKRVTLRRLASEFPHLRWLLIGDDGQHDQEIYAEFVTELPDRVAGVAIRHLSPTESVLARGLPVPAQPARPLGRRWMCAPDGAGLWRLLREADLA